MNNAFTPRPTAMTPLGRLSQYMNFWRIHNAPPVFVTMDHRAVLVAAWAAAREGRFNGRTPTLLRLDAHPDMGERPRHWAVECHAMTDLDTVHALVNDQRSDDGGWVIAAMQLGLVDTVVTAFAHDYHRFPADSQPYEDHCGARHQLGTFRSLREFLLVDHAAASVRRAMGWDPATGWSADAPPLWIDVDLDFATRRAPDDSVAEWTSHDWQMEFTSDVCAFLTGALHRAALVTIATEPEYCGGVGACGRIAEGFKSTLAPWGPWFADL